MERCGNQISDFLILLITKIPPVVQRHGRDLYYGIKYYALLFEMYLIAKSTPRRTTALTPRTTYTF